MTFWQFYFGLAGRVSRSAFWLRGFFPLSALLVSGILLDLVTFGTPREFTIASVLLAFWPSVALLLKRSHDLDWSARSLLRPLVPGLAIALTAVAVFFVVPDPFRDPRVLLLAFWPEVALLIKRCHDRGRPGHRLLWLLLPGLPVAMAAAVAFCLVRDPVRDARALTGAYLIPLLPALWPAVALLIKRCHNVGPSGRRLLWLLLPGLLTAIAAAVVFYLVRDPFRGPKALTLAYLIPCLLLALSPEVALLIKGWRDLGSLLRLLSPVLLIAVSAVAVFCLVRCPFSDPRVIPLTYLIVGACGSLCYAAVWWLLSAFRAGTEGTNRFGPDPLLAMPRQLTFAQLYIGFSGRIGWSTLWVRGFMSLLAMDLWALSLDILLFRRPHCLTEFALLLTLWAALALVAKRCHDAGISLSGRCDPKRFGPDPREHGEVVDLACASPVDRAAWFMARLWFSFSGRIPRTQFWLWCWLPLAAIAGAAWALGPLLAGEASLLTLGVYLLAGWAGWATLAKRCHDCDRPCWLLPILLIPLRVALLAVVASALGWTPVARLFELLAYVMGIALLAVWLLWFLAFVAFRPGSGSENRFGAPRVPRAGIALPAALLSPPDRIGRLTCIEIRKLVSHKLFPVAVLLTVLITAALGIAGRAVTEESDSQVRFSNYSLWVTSATYGLSVGAVLLVAIGAMAMSNEATSRTLNTLLARPIRRIEFAGAKLLSLLFATIVVVAAAALAGYVVGGTAQPARTVPVWRDTGAAEVSAPFPSYGNVVSPRNPDYVIFTRGQVMGEILFGFALLVVPVLAAVSLGFVLGTLIDAAGLAVGVSVGIFMTLEATKFMPLLADVASYFAFNYPMNQILTRMLAPGTGIAPVWDKALLGVGTSAIYVGVCALTSIIVFCRRDITL